MSSIFAPLALIPALWFAPPASEEKPKDLDKVVPAGALVHVTAGGIQSVKAAVADLMNSILPGMGGMMVEGTVQQMMAQPGMDQLDATKPISLTLLPSGTALVGAALKDAEAFEKALKGSGEDLKTVIPGEGASLLAFGGEVKLDDLRKAGTAAPASVPGTIRGFINVKDLYAKYSVQIESSLAMMQAMAAQSGAAPQGLSDMIKGFATEVPRIDFGLNPSKSGLEMAAVLSSTPEAKGFLAAIDPQAAVISVGAGNLFGHPGEETLAAVEGVDVFRTDVDGTVTFTTDGERLWVMTSRSPTP